ncbi:predicted protein [Thalassiosira pseudonana CCMP1335]|uniref:Palmitoyltransferase n=1 Tax=Thalassiosira pseudonana TaxID=35128 RepID=B8C996_THAPS|nr:predicted protein [Thalassiosira pseudonana CCMP1335]EED89816.1 predicted protein [Thalassiosira pseudonana CCMP1335]|eukprot:g5899.t1 g5899   contig20:392664-393845(+)
MAATHRKPKPSSTTSTDDPMTETEVEADPEDIGNTQTQVSSLNQPSSEQPRERLHKRYAVSVRWEREQEQQKSRQQANVSSSGPITEEKPMLTYSIEDFHRYFCCCARRVGSMFILKERQDGSPLVIAGPCWPFCTFVTVPLIAVLSSLVAYFIVLNEDSGLPWWFALIYLPIIVFVLVVLFCVSCRDPGLLERVTDEEAAENGWFWNEQVGSYRPAGAMYCRETKTLIYDYDHLCPWTGTAIGRGNMIAFKAFVVSVNVLCYLSIGLVVYLVLTQVF